MKSLSLSSLKAFVLFTIVFIGTMSSLKASSCLAPHSSEDLFRQSWISPKESSDMIDYYGPGGIYRLMTLLKSPEAQVLLHSPLVDRNLELKFKDLTVDGISTLNIEVFPSNSFVQEQIERVVNENLHRERGGLTSINEHSLGRIILVVSRQGKNAVPIFWEVQPSASWRKIESQLKKLVREGKKEAFEVPELEWRNFVVTNLARTLSVLGFKEVMAKSPKSIEEKRNFQKTPSKDGYARGFKDIITPQDVRANYQRPFINALWHTPKSENSNESQKTPFYLLRDYFYGEEEDLAFEHHLRAFRPVDRLLKRLGIQNYHLNHRLSRKGYKMIVSFNNWARKEKYSWELDHLIQWFDSQNLLPEGLNINETTFWLRKKLHIPMTDSPQLLPSHRSKESLDKGA